MQKLVESSTCSPLSGTQALAVYRAIQNNHPPCDHQKRLYDVLTAMRLKEQLNQEKSRL